MAARTQAERLRPDAGAVVRFDAATCAQPIAYATRYGVAGEVMPRAML